MPCSDSTSQIRIELDKNDGMRDFYFSKITCQKDIGERPSYRDLCLGKTIDDILEQTWEQVISDLQITEEEELFFVYLQWDALRSALLQYQGVAIEKDPERYEMVSIDVADDGVYLCQNILPPQEMPKIQACVKEGD